MAIFIYSIANTLNNKRTAKAADSIIYYSMLNRKPGKELESHLETLVKIQQYKSAIHYTAVEILTMKKANFTLNLWKIMGNKGIDPVKEQNKTKTFSSFDSDDSQLAWS